MMNIDSLTSVAGSIGGGFFGGLLLGYALKKLVKLIAVIVGLFIAGLAYLQYQQIACTCTFTLGLQTFAQTNASVKILITDAIEDLQNNNTDTALTHSNFASQELSSQGVCLRW